MNDKVEFKKLTKDINNNLNCLHYRELGVIQYVLDKADAVEHCNRIEQQLSIAFDLCLY